MLHVAHGDAHADGRVAYLDRSIKIIPAVNFRVAFIVRQAVQIFGVLEYLVTLTQHICFVLSDFLKNFLYAGVVKLRFENIAVDLELEVAAFKPAEKLSQRSFYL